MWGGYLIFVTHVGSGYLKKIRFKEPPVTHISKSSKKINRFLEKNRQRPDDFLIFSKFLRTVIIYNN
jgi:hypothetical protein